MKKFFYLLAAAVMLTACAGTKQAASGSKHSFPVVNQDGKTAIAAHRGFWKCDEAKDSQNSIAALTLAQNNGFWGSECDIHLTKDGEIIVNHDHDIDGLKIREHTYAELRDHLLKNGEHHPTFAEYLAQTCKAPKTKLVIEFKTQDTPEAEEQLIQKTITLLKEYGLYSPSRVAFISFSLYTCIRMAVLAPEFVNQYLNGDIAPAILAQMGINGIDYQYKVLRKHPEWIKEAHDNGMSVNVWTVNKEKDMQFFMEAGVDAITTNEPLLLRKVLGDKEFKNAK